MDELREFVYFHKHAYSVQWEEKMVSKEIVGVKQVKAQDK